MNAESGLSILNTEFYSLPCLNPLDPAGCGSIGHVLCQIYAISFLRVWRSTKIAFFKPTSRFPYFRVRICRLFFCRNAFFRRYTDAFRAYRISLMAIVAATNPGYFLATTMATIINLPEAPIVSTILPDPLEELRTCPAAE